MSFKHGDRVVDTSGNPPGVGVVVGYVLVYPGDTYPVSWVGYERELRKATEEEIADCPLDAGTAQALADPERRIIDWLEAPTVKPQSK